jgi:thioesterase domain-containing protein
MPRGTAATMLTRKILSLLSEELSTSTIGRLVTNLSIFIDFDFPLTSYQCNGCKVHEGFHKIWEDLANNLLACAYTLHSNHPEAPIIVTGHSLGAA